MRLRSISEAAEELGVPRQRIASGIRAKRYPAMIWGNRRLVDIDALAEIIRKEDAAEPLIGTRECAGKIGLSMGALREMARRDMVPSDRSGRYFRFRLSEVQAALRANMK